MILSGANQKLQILLAGAVSTTEPAYYAAYADKSGGAVSFETPVHGTTNGSTAVDVVAAPGSGKQRKVKSLTLWNADTASVVATVRLNDGGTTRIIYRATLASGEQLHYVDGVGFATFDDDGTARGAAGGGGGASALDDLSDVTITTPATGQALLYDGAEWVNADTRLQMLMEFHARGDASMTLTDVAAGDAFLGKSNSNIRRAELTYFTQVRFHCRVTGAATAGTLIKLRYYTSFSTTIGDYADIGTSAVQVDLAATGHSASSWIDLAAGAKADVYLAPVQTGGDGATDPAIRWLAAEFRRQ